MSLARAIAGPSRGAGYVRSIHTSARRFAAPTSGPTSSPKPARSYQRPNPPPPVPARRAARPARPVVAELVPKPSIPSNPSADKASDPAAPTTATAVRSDEWAWHRVPETEPGWITEERTIFARPQDIFAGEPGRIKFAWVFAATIIVSVIAVPTVDTLEQAKDKANPTPQEIERIERARQLKEEEKRLFAPFMTSIIDNLGLYKAGFIIVTVATVGFVTRMIGRNVARIDQIRKRPVGGQGAVNNKIRLTTTMNLANVPGWRRPKEFDLADTGVRLVGSNSGFLAMTAGKSPNYRIDFSDTSKLRDSDEETVVSLKRIQAVWGELQQPLKRRAFWSPLSDRVDRWMSK